MSTAVAAAFSTTSAISDVQHGDKQQKGFDLFVERQSRDPFEGMPAWYGFGHDHAWGVGLLEVCSLYREAYLFPGGARLPAEVCKPAQYVEAISVCGVFEPRPSLLDRNEVLSQAVQHQIPFVHRVGLTSLAFSCGREESTTSEFEHRVPAREAGAGTPLQHEGPAGS